MSSRSAVIALLWVAVLGGWGRAQVLRRCEAEMRKARSQGVALSWLVVDARSGRRLLASGESKPLIPASNMKIVTAAVALLGLGPNHELMTDLSVFGKRRGSLVEGGLRLRGEGDPTLVAVGKKSVPRFLASQVVRAGIRELRGDLVIDDSAFPDARTGPLWPSGPKWKSWLAEVDALSLDQGCVTLVVRPGAKRGRPARLSLEQKGSGVRLVNKTLTVRSRSEHRVIIERGREPSELVVRGGFWTGVKENRFSVAIADPGFSFGMQLAAALKARGVVLHGELRRVRGAEKFPHSKLISRLATPVSEVLPVMLTQSQNHRAEMLFKHCGFALGGKGSFQGSSEVVRSVLKSEGIFRKELRIKDGSGLSRGNLLSARFLVALLRKMRDSSLGPEFRKALPHGGTGTLRRRFKKLGTRVAAKTGSLKRVSALSGYLRCAGGREIVFSLLSNRSPASGVHLKSLENRVIDLLADWGGSR